MSRMLLTTFIALCVVAAPLSNSSQASRPGDALESVPAFEVIIFEVAGCYVCEAMRQRALPALEAGARASGGSLRSVDLNAPAAEHFDLAGPITLVPTLVIAEDGREVARLEGYHGPRAMNHFLSRRGVPVDTLERW